MAKARCSIDGCERPYLAGGLCGMHYQRRWSGRPMESESTPLIDRFMSFVDQSGDCWLWTGTTAGKYGQFSLLSRKVPAHRLSYEIHVGSIPGRSLVCHKCDVHICVNPAHLFLGSASDNIRDMIAKGRGGKQRASFRFKLSESDVLAVLASNAPTTHLAKQFGVEPSTIYSIRVGRSWKHIPRPKAEGKP